MDGGVVNFVPCRWRSRIAVPTVKSSFPAQLAKLPRPHGWQEKVLKELTQAKPVSPSSHEGRPTNHKGFRTQVSNHISTNPRLCRNRGPAIKNSQVGPSKRWRKVCAERCNLGRQPFRLKPPNENTKHSGKAVCLFSCALPQNTSRKCPDVGQVIGRKSQSQANFGGSFASMCFPAMRILVCCCKIKRRGSPR